MNKVEIVGLFSALDKLCELKQYGAVEEVIKKVLNEAETKRYTQKPKRGDVDGSD